MAYTPIKPLTVFKNTEKEQYPKMSQRNLILSYKKSSNDLIRKIFNSIILFAYLLVKLYKMLYDITLLRVYPINFIKIYVMKFKIF
jgi:hypothetical protein